MSHFIGINLGTTCSCIAYVDDKSKPVVGPNDCADVRRPRKPRMKN